MIDLVTLMLAQLALPLGAIADAKVWYAIPLIAAVSLVYGATRHEHPKEIIAHSIRSAIGVSTFMLVIFAIIYVAGFWN